MNVRGIVVQVTTSNATLLHLSCALTIPLPSFFPVVAVSPPPRSFATLSLFALLFSSTSLYLAFSLCQASGRRIYGSLISCRLVFSRITRTAACLPRSRHTERAAAAAYVLVDNNYWQMGLTNAVATAPRHLSSVSKLRQLRTLASASAAATRLWLFSVQAPAEPRRCFFMNSDSQFLDSCLRCLRERVSLPTSLRDASKTLLPRNSCKFSWKRISASTREAFIGQWRSMWNSDKIFKCRVLCNRETQCFVNPFATIVRSATIEQDIVHAKSVTRWSNHFLNSLIRFEIESFLNFSFLSVYSGFFFFLTNF